MQTTSIYDGIDVCICVPGLWLKDLFTRLISLNESLARAGHCGQAAPTNDVLQRGRRACNPDKLPFVLNKRE